MRQSSVDSIIDSETDACVILKNSLILRPKKHSVRKVNLYDEFNQELFPIPLTEWHRLDKCILQSFITVNLICPSNVLEYCTIYGNQTARWLSVYSIVDIETVSFVIIMNSIILQPKKHSVCKVKLYDGFNKEFIPNPPCGMAQIG